MTRPPPMMYACFVCGRRFQFGPSIYAGKHIRAYEIEVCAGCYEGNWDGWAPHIEAKLIPRLEAKGLPIPARNQKGWLPRHP